jgi:asparagine synthase (glutamine-hydrolysing)
MCGYVFVSVRNKKAFGIDQHLLRHRGPDYSDEIDLNWCRARHWRLSIQDLTSHSNQPYSNEDNVLVYNGELYNFREIGECLYSKSFESDTQLLFHSLDQEDFETIRNESGFYSFLFIDRLKRKFFGARDRFGKKPLYFYFDNDLLIVASEDSTVRTIANQYGKKASLDNSAIEHYFKYKDLHFGNTFLKGVRELAPGSTLKFDFDSWELVEGTSWKEYYLAVPFYKRTKRVNNSTNISENDPSVLKDCLFNAIEKRFLADVPVQIALSGGVDSTLLALVAQYKGDFFTRALTVSSSSRPSELKKSKFLCDSFSIQQFVINFDSIDVLEFLKESIRAQGGPLSHPHALAVCALTKEAAKQGKVLITGEGADELMYGYEHHKKKNTTFAFAQHLNPTDYFDTGKLEKDDLDDFISKNNIFENNDHRDLEVKTHLLSLLRRNDRISMQSSVELRSAFLDFKLFETVTRLQDLGILDKGKESLVKIIKTFFSDYDVDRKKIGFYVPFDEWFTKKIKVERGLKVIIEKAFRFFKDELNWTLKEGILLEGKLAWAILNIGLFLDLEEEHKR